MDDDQQFCLRWNNHQSTLVSVFDTLLEKGIHVDCTLAAEGQTLKAHKVVLSACSPYFENVLSQQYDKHPIIILKDVKYAELRAMMDYMYRGEVNISQDQLAALLKAAESLQIKGLSDNKPSRPPSRPPQAVVAAHPPRAASPPPQPRDSSVDSREGSLSPTRRRKKARRLSTEGAPPPEPALTALTAGNGEEPTCKEEAPRDGVEDLTLDEEAEEQPPIAHNDVVRNFQWHLERSQDEIMNSSDSARESQDRKVPLPPCGVVTRSTKLTDEFLPSTKTFVVLKNVTTSNMAASVPASASAPAPVTPVVQPKVEPKVEPKAEPKAEPIAESTKENKKRPPNTSETNKSAPKKLQEFFRSDDANELPCAQYRTDKGYKCPNCQRLYNARKNLVRHVTLECGREPQYKCPHCAYSKHRRNELKKHIEKKHPDKYQTRAAVVR